jgi:transcriptional regulator with XRE-family HTH domain
MEHFSEDAFLGYVAAFLDGEGSIIFNQVRRGTYIRCVFTNTHEEVLLMMQKRLGFGTVLKKKRRENWKQCFFLYVNSFDDSERLLRLIRPYLVIKAAKADKALAIIDERTRTLNSYKDRNKIILSEIERGMPQTEIAKRFGLTQQAISTIKLGHTWPSKNPSNGSRLPPQAM